MMLKLDQVHAFYGDSHILHGVSLEVNRGEVVTLLGRNGAGKTTTVRSIMGLVSVRSGTIGYKGKNILGMKPYQVFRDGLGYVPQGRRIFSNLSVAENLRLAAPRHDESATDRVLEMFPILKQRLRHRGNELSGGEQQLLAIARVLVSSPEFILLDEPSEGLAPMMVGTIMETLQGLKNQGITMLLVEANLTVASTLGDRHYIMDQGLVIHEAGTEELGKEELHTKYFAV